MPELPHLSGNDIIKLLQSLGFVVARTRGSHVVLRRGEKGCVIPLHKVAIGTLRSALKQAAISADEFLRVESGLNLSQPCKTSAGD